jgi:hypothetical protein
MRSLSKEVGEKVKAFSNGQDTFDLGQVPEVGNVRILLRPTISIESMDIATGRKFAPRTESKVYNYLFQKAGIPLKEKKVKGKRGRKPKNQAVEAESQE